MLKFAGSQLLELCSRNQREDNIGGEAFFELFFDPKCIGSVHNDAGVLRRDNGLNYIGEVVNVRERFYTENNVVEGGSTIDDGIFGALNNCAELARTKANREGRLAITRLETFIAKRLRSVPVRICVHGVMLLECLLERDAILRDLLIVVFPHQGHIAGIGRRESPREECRDSVTTD